MMNKTLLIASLLTISATSFGQAFPEPGSIGIEIVNPRGSGCPALEDGSMTAMAKVVKMDEKALGIATSYQRLAVAHDGDARSRRKFCAKTINLNIPEGWQVSATAFYTEGSYNLPVGTNGVYTFDASFQTSEGKKRTFRYREDIKVSADKANQGVWSVGEPINDPVVWSQCGRNFPLEVKSTLRLTGSRNKGGYVSMIGSESGDFYPMQYIRLRWKRC